MSAGIVIQLPNGLTKSSLLKANRYNECPFCGETKMDPALDYYICGYGTYFDSDLPDNQIRLRRPCQRYGNIAKARTKDQQPCTCSIKDLLIYGCRCGEN